MIQQIKDHEGWIALDIDGTLTNDDHLIPDQVIEYLHTLYEKKWSIVFITGRVYSFAKLTLGKIRFPFFLAVQNGSEILKMPEAAVYKRFFVSLDWIDKLSSFFSKYHEDFIIYGGVERGDLFYYKRDKFSKKLLDYIEGIQRISHIKGCEVKDFLTLGLQSAPLIKGFGTKEEMLSLAQEVKEVINVSQSVIADPFYPGLYLNLITHEKANKGKVVDDLIEEMGLKGPVIGAGNDLNDLPLLERADFGIAVANSPRELQEVADFVAPSSDDCGIIHGLEAAIAAVKK